MLAVPLPENPEQPRASAWEQLKTIWRKLNDPGRPESRRERIAQGLKIRALIALHAAGVPIEMQPKVYDPRDVAVIDAVQKFTMTSPDRIVALNDAVRYVVRNGVDGAIVECGVWRGGSMMAVATVLKESGDLDRELYLYDTYDGFDGAGPKDVDFRGRTGAGLLAYHGGDIARAPLDDVKANMASTGYAADRCHYIVGKVEDTLPGTIPDKIAVLRLDTDFYESTKQEMEHLFPLLVPGGVLILDDYGAWKGARQAVDDYLDSLEYAPLLNRIDFTGRIAVVPSGLDARVGAGPGAAQPGA